MENEIYYNLTLGIDFGTSGARAIIVDGDRQIAHFDVSLPAPERIDNHSEQNPEAWQKALNQLLEQVQQAGFAPYIRHIIGDATSSTVLVTDDQGQTLSSALMYDDARAQTQAERIRQNGQSDSAAQGANSTLAKLMWLGDHYPHNSQILHQIDWLNFQLCGVMGVTDENNALKLGYDSIHQAWPDWVVALCPFSLPKVVAAGTPIAKVDKKLVTAWGFAPDCQVYAGTTDSIAAFLASGAHQIGDAVTALGSTLAIKLLSDRPIFAAQYGIYSHKLWDKWLVGGASNAGGAVLLQHFSLEEMQTLIPKLDMTTASGLDTYPLTRPGERFPIADPQLAPKIPPTQDSVLLLKALIEGLVEVERQAYQKLEQLGAPAVKQIFGVGGGSRNQAWSDLRALRLPAKLATPISQDAAYGVTRLLKETSMNTEQLIEQLNQHPVDFKQVMQVIESEYDFTPTAFQNGDTFNEMNTNNGSCKIFAFAQMHQLSEQATLNAFGDFYTQDVLQNPDGEDHQNIRNFIKHGWQGIEFKGQALTKK